MTNPDAITRTLQCDQCGQDITIHLTLHATLNTTGVIDLDAELDPDSHARVLAHTHD